MSLTHPQSIYTLMSRYDVSLAEIRELLAILGENNDVYLETILRQTVFSVLAAVFEHDGLAIDYRKIAENNLAEERKWVRLSNFFRGNKHAKDLVRRNRKLFYELLYAEARSESCGGSRRRYHIDDVRRILRKIEDLEKNN